MDDTRLTLISKIKTSLSKHEAVVGIILSSNPDQVDDSLPNFFIIVDKNDSCDTISKLLSDNFNIKFNFVVKSYDDLIKISGSVLQDVFKSGKMIYWSGSSDLSASQVFKLRPYSLFTFELAGIPHNQKVQFNYQLYGKKNTGQIKQWEGRRIAKSCFYVPYIHKFKVTRFFSKYNIKTENTDIWI